MNELPYKEYVIEALPEKILNSENWKINIIIWKHMPHKSTEKQFSALSAPNNREEAINECFNFGKQIIDGNHEVFSVSDL